MLSILRAYCNVDRDESYSTRSSWRVQQSGIDFASATVVDVKYCHKSCFCMLCISACVHFGSWKPTVVNNTTGSMIAFSSIILTATLLKRLAATARRFLTFQTVMPNFRRIDSRATKVCGHRLSILTVTIDKMSGMLLPGL